MLDDLRKVVGDYRDDEIDDDELEMQEVARQTTAEERRFLGMTAVERMFISIFMFLAVLVVGLALLILTNRIVL